MQGFAVQELAAIFRSLQAEGWDAVLVGGQAVNVWACRYEQDSAEWRELRPYTSRDLDYHGGLAEARLAMRVLHARGRLNTGSDPSPNAGVLQVLEGGSRQLRCVRFIGWSPGRVRSPTRRGIRVRIRRAGRGVAMEPSINK